MEVESDTHRKKSSDSLDSSGSGRSSHFQTEIDHLSRRLIFLKDSLASLTENAASAEGGEASRGCKSKKGGGLKCRLELEKAESILDKVKQVL